MNTAKNGLQWVDELEGSGPAPVKVCGMCCPLRAASP